MSNLSLGSFYKEEKVVLVFKTMMIKKMAQVIKLDFKLNWKVK
jgi:hypothetical protein